MAKAKFLVVLTDGKNDPRAVHNNLAPLKVEVDRAASTSSNAVGPIEYAAASDPVPAKPNVWLQVWHVGDFERQHMNADEGSGAAAGWDVVEKYMRPEKPSDDLLIEIPGCVKETQPGLFEFRVIGDTKQPFGDPLGWITLDLKDGAGNAWQPGGKPANVKIYSNADDELDLVCTLLTKPGNKTAPEGLPFFHCTNLTHAIGSMLKEGGLTCGFHVKIPGAKPADGSASAGTDGSFWKFGEWMARAFHSIGLASNGTDLTINTTEFSSPDDITKAAATICQKVQQDFLKGKGDPPKIKRVFTLTHGDNNPAKFGDCAGAMQTGSDFGVTGDPKRLGPFLDALKDRLTSDIVWALLSESLGVAPPKDKTGANGEYGAPAPVGAGSFADVLRKGLADRGLGDAAVWAHASAGPVLHNPAARCFTKNGNAEMSWLIYGQPKTAEEARSHVQKWVVRFPDRDIYDPEKGPKFWDFIAMKLQNPTAKVSGGSTPPSTPPKQLPPGDDKKVILERRAMSAYHAARFELADGGKLHGTGPGKGWCTTGHMRGPLVDRYTGAAGDLGDLWCGMFVGYCYKRAGLNWTGKARVQVPQFLSTGGSICMSGSRLNTYFTKASGCKFVDFNKGNPWSCYGQSKGGHAAGCKKFAYKMSRDQVVQWLNANLVPYDPWPGDIILFHAGYGGFCRHVGMVASWDPKTYKMLTFQGDADGSGPAGTRAGAFLLDLSDPQRFVSFDLIGRFHDSDFVDGTPPEVSPDSQSPDPFVEDSTHQGSGDGS
jgi:hypothetical protein